MLACIALNRFHATSQYQWLRNDYKMEDKTYAVLCTSTYGEYKCRVMVDEDNHGEGAFSVTGMLF